MSDHGVHSCGPFCERVLCLKRRIAELKVELDFVVNAWCKEDGSLSPDEIRYMMSAKEQLIAQRESEK